MIMLEAGAAALKDLILRAAKTQTLKKAIFSKCADQEIKKAVLTLKSISGREVLQLESFYADNKAKHKNFEIDDEEAICTLISTAGQINLISTLGDCEYKVSKSGKCTLIGGDKLIRAMQNADSIGIEPIKRVVPGSNNKKKNYILSGDEPFLKLLEVSDKNGRVYDKKQAKFRQINRFLELVRDVEKNLPEGDLRICDLCCGKSYLSFAVYHYFANVLGRKVSMTGVDLKSDVIEYCASVALRLGFDGLEFVCGDITKYDSAERPDLVISLHACDTATDMVLEKAAEWGADVILSTPCCHHELNHKLNCPQLEFIGKYSMLRQKLCDAATDAMRLSLLEAKGYDTEALELIDPDETPKNILLRAVKRKNSRPDSRAMEKYFEIRKFLMGE